MKLAFIAAVLLQVSMIGAAQDDRSSSAWKEYVYTENGSPSLSRTIPISMMLGDPGLADAIRAIIMYIE